MVLDKRTVKREEIKRRKITVKQVWQRLWKKGREAVSLFMGWWKAQRRPSICYQVLCHGDQDPPISTGDTWPRGTAGFELSWYTTDYLLWALLLLELHCMSNTLSDGTMYKTLQLNKGLWLSPALSCREVSFTKQWLSNLVHKSDLGEPLKPYTADPTPEVMTQ